MKRRIRGYERYEQTSNLSPWEQRVYDDLKGTAEVERTQPTGAKSWTPHLAMATTAALCLALAVFVATLVIALRRGLSFEAALGDAAFGSGLTFAVTLAIAILVAVADFRGGLASVERILGRDLNGDGAVGQPEPLRAIIVRARQGERGKTRFEEETEEPTDQLARFGHFCLRCLQAGTITRREAMSWRLQPNGVHGSPKVSRSEWELWREWFEIGGLLDDLGALRQNLTWHDIEAAFPDLGGQEGGGRAGAAPTFWDSQNG